MNYHFRRLDKGDSDEMRALNRLFADVFEDNESYAATLPSDEYLNVFLGDVKNIVLVAKDGEKVVGGLVAYVITKFEMERKEVYLYDLAVSNHYQRQGIGKELIEKLKDVARNVGAYVVFVQADEGDDAVHFYRSLHPSEDLQTRNFDFTL